MLLEAADLGCGRLTWRFRFGTEVGMALHPGVNLFGAAFDGRGEQGVMAPRDGRRSRAGGRDHQGVLVTHKR